MSNADLLKELRIDRREPPPSSGNRRWLILAAVAVPALLVGGWWLSRDRAIEVQTVTVTAIGGGAGGATSVLDATGYVVARRMATVSSKITGKVHEVLIEEGQRVEAGQVMATLDPVDADAQRDLAVAQRDAARSQADSTRAQLREAEANVVRLTDLAKRQLVARAQYDQAVAQRDALRAQLTAAERGAQVAADQLRIAENGVDNTIVRAAVRRRGDRQGGAAGRDRLAAVGRRRLHPHRHRHGGGHGFARGRGGRRRGLHRSRASEDAGCRHPQRLSGLEDPGRGDRHHPHRRPRQGHGQGARGVAAEGSAHRARHGRARELPRAGAARRRQRRQARRAGADRGADRGRRRRRGLRRGRRPRRAPHAHPRRTLGDDREVTAGLAGGEQVVLSPAAGLADGAKVRVAAASAESP